MPPDPGWEPIGWDEALDTIATKLTSIAEGGPEAVVVGSASPSTSAMSDSIDWVVRLKRAFGSPNFCGYMELCGWGRYMASIYTYGEPVPGVYLPDLDNAGCILFWGYNPSVARLAHATATTAALRRGAKLIVVDPRRAGLASKAQQWLRVRPGTDGALALSVTHVMLERGWYDGEFLRDWTNAFDVVDGRVVLDLIKAECARFAPQAAAGITGVPAEQIVATARLLWDARPVAFYTWSGLEQHSNATQTVRAIGQLYALTGCIDAPGGNVLFTPVPTNPIDGAELLSPQQLAKAIGLQERPLGPARFEFVTGEDLYRAALDHVPTGPARCQLRGQPRHGARQQRPGARRAGRSRLRRPRRPVHEPDRRAGRHRAAGDQCLRAEALRVGFEITQDAQSTVQLRTPLAHARGQARSDLEIVFDLAVRLGLGDQFFGGDIEDAWRHQLAPSGITLAQLRGHPEGVRLPLQTKHRKYLDRGFRTPSGKVELYSPAFAAAGYPPIPTYAEPSISPLSRPDLTAEFPLVLTCAKSLFFCESQHRQIAKLRASAPEPQVEVHPEAAAARGIAAGDWVRLSTPSGSVRARAKLNANLAPNVVVGQHGWWQACPELGMDGYPPFGDDSANLNLVLDQGPSDPVSGSSPLRASLCELGRVSTDTS